MYGLVISRQKEGDLIKIFSSKQKAEKAAIELMSQYISNSKLEKSSLAYKTLLLVKECMSINDIEEATDLFGRITEELDSYVFLSIFKSEIICDG